MSIRPQSEAILDVSEGEGEDDRGVLHVLGAARLALEAGILGGPACSLSQIIGLTTIKNFAGKDLKDAVANGSELGM